MWSDHRRPGVGAAAATGIHRIHRDPGPGLPERPRLGTLGIVSGYANPDRPEQRLSDAERDAAVAQLLAAQAEGRLSPAEYQERAGAARAAVTQADLVPLFADLPDATPAAPTPGASAAASAPSEYSSASGYPTTPGYSSAPGYSDSSGYPDSSGWGSGRVRPLGGAVGATVMALVPFLALGLFFLFGFYGSFAWSWAFFLLIPIAGIIIYGPGAEWRRSNR